MRIFVAILTLLLASNAGIRPLHAADKRFPVFNIERNCRAELAVDLGIGETLGSCKRDEEAARDELAPQWDKFKPSIRNMCLGETNIDGTPSYVELLTCLELSDPQQ